jgi:hypothetical protein
MDDDASSCSSSISCHLLDNAGNNLCPRHKLFLPPDVSPSTKLLKYKEEEDNNDNYSLDKDSMDSNQDDYQNDLCPYLQRTYINGQNNCNSGRLRMWDGWSSITSISLSSSSLGSSRGSWSSLLFASSKKKHKKSLEGSSGRWGVTYSNSVMVYPIFKTAVYMSIYTKQEELQLNKIRNKHEFVYELHDWCNATKEEQMETNNRGELIHPIHAAKKGKCSGRPPLPRNVVQTYSLALGEYIVGSMSSTVGTYRNEQVRMYYPCVKDDSII